VNTNDFYKELFEKYAFDEEKIRRNAIKAAKTPAWQRTLGTHWKTVAGAAAAVAVTAAGVAYAAGSQGNNNGIDIVSSENILSASQRIHDAESAYLNISSEDTSISNIFVTFKEPVCFSDMTVSFSALEDFDNIEMQRLYLNDDTVVEGMTDISNFGETAASKVCIAGVKLSAPSKCYRDIQELSCVDLAEFESEMINDDTFAPLVREDNDPLSLDSYSVTTTAPAVTTTAFSFESEPTTTENTTSVSETTADTEDTEPAESDTTVEADITSDNEEAQPVEVVPDEENTTAQELDDPELTTVDTTVDTTAEITVTSEDFADTPDLGLITNLYQLNAPNALETLLIGNNAVVLSRDQVYFFKLGGVVNSSPARAVNMGSPKIAYSDSRSVIVSGCDENGVRNIIVALDLQSGILYGNDNDNADIGAAEIGRVYYSSTDDKYFVSTVSGSTTYFYEVTLDREQGIVFRPLVAFAGPVSAGGYKDGTLWFVGAEDNVNYSLYSFDCTNGVLTNRAKIGTACKVRRSLTFGSFLLTATDETGAFRSYVFDINTASLISVEVTSEALIGETAGRVFIGMDGITYAVSSEGILSEVSDIHVEFTRSHSSDYSIFSQNSEGIIVAQSNPNIWH